MARLESRVESGFDAMEKQFGEELRERMAHLGGLLEGLREAVSGRLRRQLKTGKVMRAGPEKGASRSRAAERPPPNGRA